MIRSMRLCCAFAALTLATLIAPPVQAQNKQNTTAEQIYDLSDNLPGVKAPQPISTPDPEYSEKARKKRYQGRVVLRIRIGTDGNVHDVEIRQHAKYGLDQKAAEAVKEWKFQPATKDGKPVEVFTLVEVNFHLFP
jgi:TonB family protein